MWSRILTLAVSKLELIKKLFFTILYGLTMNVAFTTSAYGQLEPNIFKLFTAGSCEAHVDIAELLYGNTTKLERLRNKINVAIENELSKVNINKAERLKKDTFYKNYLATMDLEETNLIKSKINNNLGMLGFCEQEFS